MNVKSVKRAFGLAASAVGASGAMILVPTVANAATAHPQTASNISRTSWGWGGGWGGGGWGWGFDRDRCDFDRWGGWGFDRDRCCGFDRWGGWGV
jgi:hypothetical protein